jgi:Uma2 family endonuclease
MQEAVELALDPERTYEIVDGQPVLKDPPYVITNGLDPERTYEFVDGQPVEKEMPGARHSGICGRLERRLGTFVENNGLGEVYPESTFQIGARERVPDLAFISAARLPEEGEPATKWLIAPDLAVEIVSPNDFYEQVHAKALEYLAAGVQQVWLVSPETETITVFRSPSNVMAFPPESELISEDLLPGFRCPLREIFKSPLPSREQA